MSYFLEKPLTNVQTDKPSDTGEIIGPIWWNWSAQKIMSLWESVLFKDTYSAELELIIYIIYNWWHQVPRLWKSAKIVDVKISKFSEIANF